MVLRNQIERIILDADDTLWENNIFYVEAERDITQLIAAEGADPAEIKKRFDETEKLIVKERGYGSKNFILILEELFHAYQNRDGARLDASAFREIVRRFEHHPERQPLLFPGVIETLAILHRNYELYVLTKGDYREQLNKIRLSGILEHLDGYFIAEEKNDAYYRKLLTDRGWAAATTCMVGNSPKSDINPALRLGMYAVFIPYEHTWKLDHEDIEPVPGRFFNVSTFEKLKELLCG